MHFYLYEIRNKINGKIYIGVHSTSKIDDGYMGSGKLIKRAIAKYGIENFSKRILETFATSEDMYRREREVVNEEFVKRNDVYNVKIGGPANFYYVNKNGMNHKSNQHLIHGKRIKNDPAYAEKFRDKMTIINKEIGRRNRGKPTPSKGKIWASNDDLLSSKMFKLEEFIDAEREGWYRGLKYRRARTRNQSSKKISRKAMKIKRDVTVEWFENGNLAKTETYKNRTVFVAKDGSEKINWMGSRSALDADGVFRVHVRSIAVSRAPFPWM